MKNAFVVFVVACLAYGSETRSEDVGGLKLNQNTIVLLTSEPGSAGSVLEIANALPIIGRGSLLSINGLPFLRSIDAAPLSSDSFAYVKQSKCYKGETGKLAYLAKHANMNVNILPRKDNGVNEDLSRMRTATDLYNGDGVIAGELVFGSLGTNCGRVANTGNNSLATLLYGCIDATVFTVAGLHTLLNSVRAKGGLVFSILVAGSQ